MADKFDKITDAESITSDVDVWQSNKRHTESEFKAMFKSPTLKLIDRFNETIDDVNERIMSTERKDNVRKNGSLQSRIAQNEEDIDNLQHYESHVKELADAALMSSRAAADSESRTMSAKKEMEEQNAATIVETNTIKDEAVKQTNVLKEAAENARDIAQKFAVNSPSFDYNGNTYYSAKYWAQLSRSYYENRNKAFVFDTTDQVLAWYDGTFIRADGLTRNHLVIGDLILIKEINVPDVWYSGEAETETSYWWSGYPFALWEGDKVALLEYTERAETACENAELLLLRTQEFAAITETSKNAAISAKDDSQAARNDAETFAGNSEASANAAKVSENAAKLSETNAKNSENNAKTSEEKANASEKTALLHANASNASADAAAASATASADSAAQSSAKAQEAAQSETNAASSATASERHKTAAESAQMAAETARDNARKSATDAGKSADNAKASEVNAASSANDSNSSSVHSETQAEAALAAAVRAEAAAQRTEAIAGGLQKKLVFDTVQAVRDWYNNNGTITVNGQSYTPADLRVGDDIYVIETGVSDVWYVGAGKNETDTSVWWHGLPFTYLETNSEELIGYSEEAKAARDAAKTSETLAGQYAAQAQVSAGASEASRQASEAAKTASEAAKNAARTSETNAAGSASAARVDADYVRDIRDSLVLSDGTYVDLGAGKDGSGNNIVNTYARKEELPKTPDDLNKIATFGYVMSGEKVIDATGLDENKWYPVTVILPGAENIRIEVYAILGYSGVPSWAIHSGGFSCCRIWETNASTWGANEVNRRILASGFMHAQSDPIREIGQKEQNSNEYFYIRGGGKFYFHSSRDIEPVLNPEGYSWTYSDPQYSYTLPVLDAEPADSPITIVDTESDQTIGGKKDFADPLYVSAIWNRGGYPIIETNAESTWAAGVRLGSHGYTAIHAGEPTEDFRESEDVVIEANNIIDIYTNSDSGAANRKRINIDTGGNFQLYDGLYYCYKNGITSTFGNQNANHAHFTTTAPYGFHFNNDIYALGNLTLYKEGGNEYIVANSDGQIFDTRLRVYSPNNPPTQMIAKDGSNPVFVLPYVPWETIEPNHDSYAYFKELLKWICRNYPNVPGGTWIGRANPNSVGPVIIDIYDTSVVNSEGLPQYSTGTYRSITNRTMIFSTLDYVYNFKELEEYFYSDENPPPSKYEHNITCIRYNNETWTTFKCITSSAVQLTTSTAIASALFGAGFSSDMYMCMASGWTRNNNGQMSAAAGVFSEDGITAYVKQFLITGQTQTMNFSEFTAFRDAVITI